MLLGTVSLWALNFTVSKYILDEGFQPLAYAVGPLRVRGTDLRRDHARVGGIAPHRPRSVAADGPLHGAPVREPAELRLRAEVHDGDDGGAAVRDAADLHRDPRPRLRRRAPERPLLGRRAALVLPASRSSRSARAAVSPPTSRATRSPCAGALTWAGYSVAIAPLMRRYSPVPAQRRLPRRRHRAARAGRVAPARRSELRLRRAGLARLRVRGGRARS